MNILVFAHDSRMYGASQSLLTALAGIVKKEHRNVLVLLPYPGKMEDALRSAGIRYEIVPFPLCMASHASSKSFLHRARKVYQHYKQLKLISPRLEAIARRFKTDVIYTNTSVVVAGFSVSRRLGIPHVWHVREVGENFVYPLGRPYIAKAIAESERSLFVSQFVKRNWVTKGDSRNSVVYNGIVDVDGFLRKESRELRNGDARIGIVGAVLPGKGQHIAIEAFARVAKARPGSQLLIYGGEGEADYSNTLRQLVQRMQIEKQVIFKSFVDDRNEIYGNLDVLLTCGTTDSFGRTVVEAMDRGIPVIANASGGITEVVEAETDCLLFDGTSEGLARSLARLLSNHDLYRTLSVNGLRKAEKFSVRNYVDSVDSILEAACASTVFPDTKWPHAVLTQQG